MKILKLSLLFTSFMLLNSQAFASCTSISCVNKIDRLYIAAHNDLARLYVRFPQQESPSNCNLVSGNYMYVDSSYPAFNPIFDILLSSKNLGKPVLIRTSPDDNSECKIDYVVLDN